MLYTSHNIKDNNKRLPTKSWKLETQHIPSNNKYKSTPYILYTSQAQY